jgi:putative hemolysin
MSVWTDNLWSLLMMVILLGCSAFFSACETAFFNLSKRQIGQLLTSPKHYHRLAGGLMQRPKQLLTTLLLGNMTVNVLYFSLTSSLVINVSHRFGRYAAVLCAAVGFIVLVLSGEMLPKSFAYSNSLVISILTAVPAFICIYIFAPVRVILNWLFVVPTLRLLAPSHKKPRHITARQFKVLIESSRQKGLITEDENQFLSAVVELGVLKVRHIMRPRVDMVLCRSSMPAVKAIEILKKRKSLLIFIYSGKIDNIIGWTTMRQLILNPARQLRELAEEVRFVPEQKKVDALLETFLKQKFDIAVAVDEFGQTAGVVGLEDIIDHIIGTETDEQAIKPIEQIGPMQYRLAGDLSVHHWAEDFGLDYTNARFSTVAGLTAALLGKVPKSGDVAYLQNLKFTVETVHKHRIKSIILSFEPFRGKK